MPWYAFDPDDVGEDSLVSELNAPALALFHLLFQRSLKRGHLADDPEAYRHLWGSKFTRFDEAWRSASACFDRDPDGLLCLDWIDKSREDTLKRMRTDKERKKSERAQKFEQERQNAIRPHGRPRGTPKDVRATSSATSTSTGQDRTGQDIQYPTGGAPSERVRKRKKTEPEGNPEHRPSVAHWESEWSRTRNGDVYVMPPRDHSALKELLGKADGAEVRRRMTAMLEDTERWIASNANIVTLRSNWNRYTPSGPGKSQGQVELERYTMVRAVRS